MTQTTIDLIPGTYLVIDPVTDATKTASSIRVLTLPAKYEQTITDPATIRALHDHPTARPYSGGSYTIQIPGEMYHLHVLAQYAAYSRQYHYIGSVADPTLEGCVEIARRLVGDGIFQLTTTEGVNPLETEKALRKSVYSSHTREWSRVVAPTAAHIEAAYTRNYFLPKAK